MKLVCYAFKNAVGEIQAPFLEYLRKYAPPPHETAPNRLKRLKQLDKIYAHLRHLVDHQGSYSLSTTQGYKGRNIGILKIKESQRESLVRIAFYTVVDKEIVLLDAFDKPLRYEKAKAKQVNKMIQEFLDKVENYRNDYIKQQLSIKFQLD